jgi:Xaa-Pro aminopeptidase
VTERRDQISPESPERHLQSLLADSGSGLTALELRQIVHGVAAAPPASDRDGWMRLVADRPSPQLHQVLNSMLERARAQQERDVSRREDAWDHGWNEARGARQRRLSALRAQMRKRNLAGFVVPRTDEHQGEYVPARSERLAWLTGFTGSAGTAVILDQRAALFIDGRYTVQAAAEVDAGLFTLHHATHEPLGEWLSRELPATARLGYDPWLHTPNQVVALQRACSRAGARAVPVPHNPVDRIWGNRPPPPIAPVVPHPLEFAGDSSLHKRVRIAELLRKQHQDVAFLSQPDSIAWLLNIRGGDLPYTPTPLAFALLRADTGVQLFLDPRKLTAEARAHLDEGVAVVDPRDLGLALDRLGAGRQTVRLDPDAAPEWVARRLRRTGAVLADGPDPCVLPKATKTATELAGIRNAHRRDGAALTRFLAWLSRAAANGTVSESAAARRLEAFRSGGEHYRGPSFPTISGAGGNGAIVHYRVSPETDRMLEPGSLYLVDSGGQYLDGTTDVTRTVAVGEPSREMCERFTLVLKGHVALATALFPRGTTGSQLDAFARAALWRRGLDYDHGTGHGVGLYLGVHEGPQRISKLPSRVALQPGMVVSNEPGYYKQNAYGIRIENLVAVVQVPAPAGAEMDLLGFETLTLAPIDRRLIVPALLDESEANWLDAYHAEVREKLTPLLDPQTKAWLADATRPVR